MSCIDQAKIVQNIRPNDVRIAAQRVVRDVHAAHDGEAAASACGEAQDLHRVPHDQTSNPNEFSTPETFQKAMDMSKYAKVNLDIGHLTAAGYDPIAYIEERHAAGGSHRRAQAGSKQGPARF